jgi:hypothetical protein
MDHSAQRRVCTRNGCVNAVKKPTAKYCSVGCCAKDPARHARLRAQARRGARRSILPMSHQLSLGLPAVPANPEALIATLCDGREDLPRGMSRLAG